MSNDSVNPYASPAPTPEPAPTVEATNRRLYEIAKAQNFLILVVLFALIAGIGMQAINRAVHSPAVFWVAVSIQLAISTLQSVAMFRMGKTVHNLFQAVGLAIFSFVPGIGLILMLIVNNHATAALRAGGIQVGFMGTDLKQFDPAIRGS